MRLTLEALRPETSDVVTFLFRPEEPFTWRAGQFLHYTLPHSDADARGVERYFTIASAPHERHVQITTRFSDPGSTFKRALKKLNIGDVIEADSLDGDFVVDDPSRPMVFVAGGMGITPYRSILLDLDHRGVASSITILYGNRTDEFVFKDELGALTKKHSGLSIRYVVSPAHIDESSILALAPVITQPIFYISGPEPMVEHFEKTLPPLGIPEENLKRDYFPGYQWPL